MDDPVFGRILQNKDKRSWRCSAKLPGVERTPVRIHARDDGPSEIHRRLFLQLMCRYYDLRPTLAVHIYDAYERIRTSDDLELAKLSAPTDIWSIARLSTIEIYAHRSIDLALLYKIDWQDPDHVLTVTLKDWQVTSADKDG